MTPLYALFGSALRVRLLRALILSNEARDIDYFAQLLQVQKDELRKELRYLLKAKYIKEKSIWMIVPPKKAGAKVDKKRAVGYALVTHFPYRDGLRTLLMQDEALSPEVLARQLKPLGKWTLVLLTGVFTRDFDSDVDMLLVGTGVDKAKLESMVLALQAEIGVELRYAVLSPDEYEYRYQMFDKFVRDVLDSEHIRPIDIKRKGVK